VADAPKKKAPEQTSQEPQYLRRLIDSRTPVEVKLSSGQEYRGTVEYYDSSFIRLTRDGAPNLFIFKKDIKYLFETDG
jgi:sRNA-binding regulator protein Hfq